MYFVNIFGKVFVTCTSIFVVVFGVISIAMINISRDLQKTTALLTVGYPTIGTSNRYTITRLYEYSVDSVEYIGKTQSKEYDKETAYSLSGEGVGELVEIYYERANPRNIHETRGLITRGYTFGISAILMGMGAFCVCTCLW